MNIILKASVGIFAILTLSGFSEPQNGPDPIQSTPQVEANDSLSSLNNMSKIYTAFGEETARASDINNYSSASSIASSVINSPNFTRVEMVDSAKAIAILAAIKSPSFRQGIDNIINFTGKDTIIAQLENNPALVKSIQGYDEAEGYASSATSQVFDKIENSAATLHQASYSMQKEAWSQAEQEKQPILDKIKETWENYSDIAAVSYTPAPSSSNIQINDKIMAAAALYLLNDNEGMMRMLDIGSGKSCTFTAYLNLRMCIAASKYPYEHSFCLSQHAYSEPNNCAKEAVSNTKSSFALRQ